MIHLESKYYVYLVLGIVFLIFSAFFSAAETAFNKLNKYRYEVKKDEGSKTAKLVLWLYERKDTNLISILIGNNVVNTLLSVLSTSTFLYFLSTVDAGVVSLVSSICITLIVYLIGETMPKQIAGKIPNTLAGLFAYPLVVLYFLFFPLSILFRGISFLVAKIFPSKHSEAITEDDFSSILKRNQRGGLLEKNETEIIENSLDFSDTAVKEVLTPKNKMFSIDLKGMTNVKLVDLLCGTTYSRIPVYFENKDKILGVLLVKQYLSAYLKSPTANILSYVEKPYIVSPSVKIDDLVDGFRENHTQIALVMKKNELIGMVTMEDVLEELVGPIGEKIALEGEKR